MPRIRTLGGRKFIAEGLDRHPWSDFYHDAMTVSWPRFVAALATAFVTLNLLFALVYMAGEAPIANAKPGSFSDLFFFSVETTSTVGYGDMHPQTLFGHLVATAENFAGMVSLAVMTGLVFSRFSRPRARVIFARSPVICMHNGQLCFAIRMANARNSYISEATAKMWMIGPTITAEGRRFVAFHPMKLTRGENPTFALTWTLFHPIDEDSPIFDLGDEDLAASEMNFVVSVSGLDETSMQMVRARSVFAAQDVRPQHEYADIVRIDAGGLRWVDFSRLNETRAAASAVTKS